MSGVVGSSRPGDLPRFLGGFEARRELERGPLGVELEARRRSSGEVVRLRVVRPEWACLPSFVAHLGRNARAASLARHPNLLSSASVEEHQGRVIVVRPCFDATSLAERIGCKGALPPREAVATVLQAARGLAAAHRQGLTHGDVGPASILVDSNGLTRLTDLGLRDTPSGLESRERRAASAPIALGGGAGEDDRPESDLVAADVRGLGRSLASAITGRLDEDGDSPVDASSLIARGVPVNLVELIEALSNAHPGGSLGDASQAVAALERFLTSRKPEAMTPREEHASDLRLAQDAFLASPSARLRRNLTLEAIGICGLLCIFSLLGQRWILALCFLALGWASWLATFIARGLNHRDPLLQRARRLVLESRGGDLLVIVAALGLALGSIVLFDLIGIAVVFGLIALAIGLAFALVLDRKVDQERRAAIDDALGVIKGMRVLGIPEHAIRSLARSSGGREWRVFLESLFGFDAMIAAIEPRDKGVGALFRERHFPWREWLDAWVGHRLDERDRDQFTRTQQVFEERALVATGVNLVTARRRAARRALAIDVAMQSAFVDPIDTSTPRTTPETIGAALRRAIDNPEDVLLAHVPAEESATRRRFLDGLDRLTGARARFFLGAVLLAGFLAWAHRNEVVSGTQIRDVATRVLEKPGDLDVLKNARIDIKIPVVERPLEVPWGLGAIFRGLAPAFAGMILIASAFIRGSRVGWFAIPGALLALVGDGLGVPAIGPLGSTTTSMVLGSLVAALGWLLGKAKGE